MAEPSNSNPDPAGGGGSDPGAGGGEPKGGTPPAATPPQSGSVDLSKLDADQLNKVLENPELFKTPRIKQLLDDSAALKKLQDDQAKATEQKLKDEKKFEELSQAKEAENAKLREQIKTNSIDQALTTKLVPEGVVDLEGALKLVNRSKIEVKDDGTVTGIDEAIEALKTDKSYLFGKGGGPTVGSPTNPQGQPSGPAKFKRSQLRDPAFYAEHRDEILAAQKAGLIEDDVSQP